MVFVDEIQRTASNVYFYWTSSDGTFKGVGTTKLYRREANGTYTLLETRTANASTGISFTGPTNVIQGQRKSFAIDHRMSNPFCALGGPAIDYNLTATVDRVGGYAGFTVQGAHDKAPNYEFYFRNSTYSTSAYSTIYSWVNAGFTCLSPILCAKQSFSITK